MRMILAFLIACRTTAVRLGGALLCTVLYVTTLVVWTNGKRVCVCMCRAAPFLGVPTNRFICVTWAIAPAHCSFVAKHIHFPYAPPARSSCKKMLEQVAHTLDRKSSDTHFFCLPACMRNLYTGVVIFLCVKHGWDAHVFANSQKTHLLETQIYCSTAHTCSLK